MIDLSEQEHKCLRALTVSLRPLGYALTERTDPQDTPTRPAQCPDEQGRVVVFDEYAAGLEGLEGFDYAWLLVWFDRVREPAGLRVEPHPLRETGERKGVFATRSPARPNPLGLSLVRVLGIEDSTIRFAGVDLVRATPVLDIKPYVPDDRHLGEAVRSGWLDRLG